MLKSALGFLSSAGRLVYATCSLEPEENEGVVERVLEESPGVPSRFAGRAQISAILRSARCLILRDTCAPAPICTPWTASLLL